ncbi:retrovirus-related pol polyprotein from transposon TNT 1-94 [Tanacetum coccineum]
MLFIMLSWKRVAKDLPPMLARGNYVQWKSKNSREYHLITKPVTVTPHYSLKNPPDNIYQWAEENNHKRCRIEMLRKWKASSDHLTGIVDNVISISNVVACRMHVKCQCPVLTSTQQEWQRFVTLVKQSQELKTVSYHKHAKLLGKEEKAIVTSSGSTYDPELLRYSVVQSSGIQWSNSEGLWDAFHGNVEPKKKHVHWKDDMMMSPKNRRNWKLTLYVHGHNFRGTPDSVEIMDHFLMSKMKCQGKEEEVEDHRRKFKFSNNKTSVTACNDSVNAKTSNVNFVCVTCGKCVLNDNHDLCVLHYINGVNSRTRQPMAVPVRTTEPKHDVNKSVATSSKKTVATDSTVKKSRNITRKLYEQVSKTCSWCVSSKYTPSGYKWKPKSEKGNVNPNVSMPLGNASRTANILEHKTPRCSTVSNTPLSSNSFAARRDSSIHLAFRKSTCYIRDLKGNDLLTGSRGTDLYSISLQDSTSPNPICLMAKATSSQAWLWHRRLSHLNFDTINLLQRINIVKWPSKS